MTNQLHQINTTLNKELINLQDVYESSSLQDNPNLKHGNPFEYYQAEGSGNGNKDLANEVLTKSKFLNEHLSLVLTETDG